MSASPTPPSSSSPPQSLPSNNSRSSQMKRETCRTVSAGDKRQSLDLRSEDDFESAEHQNNGNAAEETAVTLESLESIFGKSARKLTLGKSFMSKERSGGRANSNLRKSTLQTTQTNQRNFGGDEKHFDRVRYDFLPSCIDNCAPYSLKINDDKSVEIDRDNQTGSKFISSHYIGSIKKALKECVLLVDRKTGKIVLEKIDYAINLKKSRDKNLTNPNSFKSMPTYNIKSSQQQSNSQEACDKDSNIQHRKSILNPEECFDEIDFDEPDEYEFPEPETSTKNYCLENLPIEKNTVTLEDRDNKLIGIDNQNYEKQNNSIMFGDVALNDLADDLRISEDSSS